MIRVLPPASRMQAASWAKVYGGYLDMKKDAVCTHLPSMFNAFFSVGALSRRTYGCRALVRCFFIYDPGNDPIPVGVQMTDIREDREILWSPFKGSIKTEEVLLVL